jgi:hypothetical protein
LIVAKKERMLKLVVSGDPILENDAVSIVAILEPPNDPSEFAKGHNKSLHGSSSKDDDEKKEKALPPDDEDIFLVLIDQSANPALLEGAAREVQIPPSQGMLVIFPYPNRLPTDRFSLYCAGPTNCGKSTILAKTAEVWGLLKRNKGKPIHIFCRGGDKDHDPAFRFIKPKPYYFPMDETILKVKTDDLRDSLVIFDDVDVIPDKQICAHIMGIRADILQNGRKKFIDVMNSSHLVLDFNKTKLSVTESTVAVIFPTSGMQLQIERLMKCYMGLGKPMMEKVKALKKWVAFTTIAPRIAIHSHGAFAL